MYKNNNILIRFLLISILGIITLANAQILSESFEDATFPPTGWTLYNNNGGATWIRAVSNPHTGTACAQCQANSPYSDDWLVTPQVAIPSTGAELKFWYREGGALTTWHESLEVWVSTTGNALIDFTTMLDAFWFGQLTYLERVVSLNSYAGQNIYIAIVAKSPNEWYLNIDDVEITGLFTNDVGVQQILSPGSQHMVNTLMTPSVKVKNFGSNNQNNFPVVCSIVNSSGVVRHTNTKTISLAAGRDTTINFTSWTPTTIELCTVKMRTALASDENPTNNQKSQITNVTNALEIIIGTGTSASGLYLMYGYSAYAGSEAIYLQPEIGYYGNITNLAYYKGSGTDVNPVQNVAIFMRHTTAATVATGAYDTIGYTRVFTGSFTNNATTGWMDVRLDNSFQYNNVDNLQILIAKGPPALTTGYPSYRYTTTSPNYQNRYGYGASVPTSLTQTYYRPNIRFALTPSTLPANDVGVQTIIYPLALHRVNIPMVPIAKVKNYGSATQTFPVVCSIIGTGGVTRYTNTQTVTVLASLDTIRVNFAQWIPSITENVTVVMRTRLTGDTNAINDRMTRNTEISLIYLAESFDDATFPPSGWARYNFDAGAQQWDRYTTTPNTPPACAVCRWETTTLPNNDWLITPRIGPLGSDDSLIFYYRNFSASYTDSMNVKLSPFPDVSDTSRYVMIDFIQTNGNAWLRKSIGLASYTGNQIFFAFQYIGTDNFRIGIDDIRVAGYGVAVEENPNKFPLITSLNAPKPNPATKGLAKISFTISEPTKTSVRIYDASGRLIKTLVNSNLGSGVYNYTWNGTDEHNNTVAEGVYFYTLETDKHNITKKLVLTR